MRAVVTGATGLVGANLAAELVSAGVAVRCTRRRASRTDVLDDLPIEWSEADLGDARALARACDGADVVFHCAALVDTRGRATEAMWRTNVAGTEHVIDAVRRAGVTRLVHCSSAVTVGVAEEGRPIDETAPWNLARHGLADGYVVTKREAESRVLAAARDGLDAVVVNPTYVLGPRDCRPSSGRLILHVVHGRYAGYSTGSSNFVDARDVARGMRAAWQHGRRGERYLLGGENLSYRDILTRIAALAGAAPPRRRIPAALGIVAGWLGELPRLRGREPGPVNRASMRWAYRAHLLVSSAKAERELGYRFAPIDAAIRDALLWFRARGLAP